MAEASVDRSVEVSPEASNGQFEELESVAIRFAGDSGDGMQLTGTQFTNTSAVIGNDIATFPDFPAEIRAPAGTLAGVSGFQVNFSAHDIFTPRFLLKRPLLQAIDPDDGVAPVLLIDELDRTDEAFEAFLLEVLSDFQVTIPELGTVKAAHPPIVVVTSNRTREIHDALKRRCLYHWLGYPNAERELSIVRAKVPGIAERLSREIVHFVQSLRREDLFKAPGVAETLDWASALSELDAVALDPATVSDTLGVLLKYQDDIARLEGTKAKELLDEVRAQLRAAE